MHLDRVTITGADDSVEPQDIVDLSREFPFVEWGILASQKSTGRSSRFPSREWMIRLQAVASQNPMNLSLHLCGRWVRELLIGKRCEQLDDAALFLFQRVQLNFHAENTRCHPLDFCHALSTMGDREFIFQIDGSGGNEHLEAVNDAADCHNYRLKTVALFDLSGGAGVLPESWPKPIYLNATPGPHGEGVEQWAYHGYAGGLSPDNLAVQIPLIAQAADGARFWIDMETRVRSDDDRQFDLGKVRKALEIAAPFVRQPVA